MSLVSRSIYLHFLDRELGESVGYQTTALEVQKSLHLLTLIAGASLNCGTSLLFESPAICSSPSLFRLSQILMSSGWLHLLSSHTTIDEFLESRGQLYQHDRLRYPMYFDNIPQLSGGVRIVAKSSSATKSLVSSLTAWGLDAERASDRERDAKKVVLESLARREERAVTAAIFAAASASSTQPSRAIGLVRRRISNDYTSHFMGVLGSDIATGMQGLDYFDNLSLQYPNYDIPILFNLSRLLGLGSIIEADWETNRDFWEKFLYKGTSDPYFQAYLDEIGVVFSALTLLYKNNLSTNILSFRTYVTQALDQLSTYFSNSSTPANDDLFANLVLRARNIISHLEHNPMFKGAVVSVKTERQMNKSCDVLVVVATEVELRAVIDKFKSVGSEAKVLFDGGRAFYDLGYLNGRRIVLVKVEMGSSTIGGSTTTTMRMVEHLSPKWIVMVGIAFGVDKKKQSIGQVLISRQVLSYDLQRVGTNTQGDVVLKSRGDRTSAHPTLVSLFQATMSLWSEAPVEAGLLLSGDKLVDNIDFREQIKSFAAGEAIGGEMEGTGVILGSAETSTPWIIVKAICDWADGQKAHNKKQRQETAARNAVSFMFRALQIETGGQSEF